MTPQDQPPAPTLEQLIGFAQRSSYDAWLNANTHTAEMFAAIATALRRIVPQPTEVAHPLQRLRDEQQDLSPEAAKVLRDNLWQLYGEDARSPQAEELPAITSLRNIARSARHAWSEEWARDIEICADHLAKLLPPPEPPAPTLRALIEQAIVKHFYDDEGPRIGPGRFVRCKLCRQGGTVGGTLATGYQHTPTCWVPAFNADLLAALLPETDGPAPQEQP